MFTYLVYGRERSGAMSNLVIGLSEDTSMCATYNTLSSAVAAAAAAANHDVTRMTNKINHELYHQLDK